MFCNFYVAPQIGQVKKPLIFDFGFGSFAIKHYLCTKKLRI